MHEDAIQQYDELENLFQQVLKEKNMSWFGNFINCGPKDDSASLLSPTKKSYRDLILANAISVFDLRIYLLLRQCQLLRNMGELQEICHTVGVFLGSFGMKLREVEVSEIVSCIVLNAQLRCQSSLPKYFVESWKYTSALSVVDQCDQWASSATPEGSDGTAYQAARGELLELARMQLDRIGLQMDYLPSKPPFTLCLSAVSASQGDNGQQISNQALVDAMATAEAFYNLYFDLTNRAVDSYAKGKRRKFALKMHGSLAALDLSVDSLSRSLHN